MESPSRNLAMLTFTLAGEPGYLIVETVTAANQNDGMHAPKTLAKLKPEQFPRLDAIT